jgi:hypothetical protein
MGMKVGTLLAAALGAAALPACGELHVPDLSTGEIAGRLTGAQPGAYAYVLGAPDRLATVGPDGSFAIARAPAGPQQVVLFDGATRAVLTAAVEVRGGDRTRLPERAADTLPLAGRIVAAARTAGGALPTGVRFTVEGTILRDVPASGSGALLGPLPAGDWRVTAALPGFRPLPLSVAVAAGLASGAEVELDVDERESPRGCQATTCPNGLHCDPADGRCKACVTSAHCGPDDACDPLSSTCVEGTLADGALCESSSGPGFCAAPSSPPGARVAWVPTPGTAVPGYCSVTCAVRADCPAGWDCLAGACQVVRSCLATASAFGSPCTRTTTCLADLAGGRCLRADDDSPGFCTAPCSDRAPCPAGLACLPGGPGADYCQRAP